MSPEAGEFGGVGTKVRTAQQKPSKVRCCPGQAKKPYAGGEELVASVSGCGRSGRGQLRTVTGSEMWWSLVSWQEPRQWTSGAESLLKRVPDNR